MEYPDFIELYLKYTAETEPPTIYHRWCAITAIGALLGRNRYIKFGHSRIFPNVYCMFIGEAGSRKSTAIKLTKKLLIEAEYETFSTNKTSEAKFLLNLEGRDEEDILAGQLANGKRAKPVLDSVTEEHIWGKDASTDTEPREVFIVADEFNVFIGTGNIDFCTTLGDLWDWDSPNKPWTQGLKNSASVSIFQPTVSILGGNTAENFMRAFPPEMLGNGFLSRLVIIHAEPSSRQYPFPPEPDDNDTKFLINYIRTIKADTGGQTEIDADARSILGDIYKRWEPLPDTRFKYYNTRRYIHLLKTCIIMAASQGRNVITAYDVIRANTILAAAELSMPTALGEFGKGRNSDVASKVMTVINDAKAAIKAPEIWKSVHKDLEKPAQLQDILDSLRHAGKLQYVKDHGWLPKKEVSKDQEYVDWSLITPEERGE